jgi:Arc/MetJ-type ribon-helix-helix transcriptional regulator
LQKADFKDASELVDEAIHYLLDMDKAEVSLRSLCKKVLESGPAIEE